MDIRNQRRFSVAQAAKKTGMSAAWWRSQIAKGTVCYIQIGKRQFLPEETLRNIVKVIEPTETDGMSKRVI